jgi:hypothetical protein
MQQTLDTRAIGGGAGTVTPQALSAASWSAIVAGAFVAAAVSLILFALGSGIGFASISPWPDRGVSATTFTVTTAIWLIVTQWVSAGVGGYIAGRLRTRWVGTHAHEIFFRDTAHGLVTWAVATLLIAGAVATSVFSAIGGGAHAVSGIASAGVQGASGALGAMSGGREAMSSPGSPSLTYDVDRLFRSADPASGTATGPGATDPRAEAAHIVVNAMTTGTVPEEDKTYLAGLVAARTGASPSDVQKRVDEFVAGAIEAQTKVKAAADAARKAAAETSIYTALSLLVGAFIASVAAAMGGRQRDEHL